MNKISRTYYNSKQVLSGLWNSPNAKFIFPWALLILSFIIAVIQSRGGFIHRISESFDWMIKFGTPLCLTAIGASLVISSGGVDISSAGVASLSGLIFGIFLSLGWNIYIAVAIGILVAVAFGFISGTFLGWAVAIKNSPPLIFSWALGILLFTVAIYISSRLSRIGFSQSDTSGIYINNLKFSNVSARFLLVIILVIAQIISYVGLTRKACAIGANRDSAVYAGIRLNKTTIWCYIYSGMFAALSGVVWTFLLGKAATTAFAGKEIISIAVAVMGGTVMSGGYLNIFSVIAASYFFSNFQKITNNINISGIAQQQQLIDSIFALIFILLVIFFGKKINGITHPIQVERNTKNQ